MAVKVSRKPSKDEEDLLLTIMAALGGKEVVIEVDGEEKVLKVRQYDAEGRELLQE